MATLRFPHWSRRRKIPRAIWRLAPVVLGVFAGAAAALHRGSDSDTSLWRETRLWLRTAPQRRPSTDPRGKQLDAMLLAARRSARHGPGEIEALQSAIEEWLRAEPLACLRFVAERGCAGLVKDRALRELIHLHAGDDLDRASHLTKQISNGWLRERLIRLAFEKKIETDPHGALHALSTIPGPLRRQLGELLVEEWVKRDAATAIRVLGEIKDDHHDSLFFHGLRAWAENSPEEVVAFYGRVVEDPAFRSRGPQILSTIGNGSGTEPEIVLRLLNQLPASAQRQASIGSFLSGWFTRDAEAALAWVRSLPDELVRSQYFTRMVGPPDYWPRDEAFALQLLEQIPGYGAHNEVVLQLAAWKARKPGAPAAAEWAARLEDPLVRRQAMGKVMNVWLEYDPLDAAAFAFAQPEPASGPDWLRVMFRTAEEDVTMNSRTGRKITPDLGRWASKFAKVAAGFDRETQARIRREAEIALSGAPREAVLEVLPAE
ncbi:MAG: hypothetical protein M3463_19240 [Verrucomicrobiota bacterium]|nr:hypothetical protein [Verrucomicrobiota bacterium]